MKNLKFKNIILMVCVIMITIPLLTETVAESPSNYDTEGAGLEHNPFLIANLANLRWLSENNWYWNTGTGTNAIRFHFLQTADIDASETVHWNEGRGFNPIGQVCVHGGGFCEFRGTFDGNNYFISNLFINNPLGVFFIAMFNSIRETTLQNINLVNINYVSNMGSFGGIVGYAFASTISNSMVCGSIIINGNQNQVTTNAIGGLVCRADMTTIVYSYSLVNISGNISNESTVGGLVGSLSRSNMSNSYFYGNISIPEQGNHIGGLVGRSGDSSIENVYIAGTSVFENVASLIGRLSWESCINNTFWDIETTGITDIYSEMVGENIDIGFVQGLTTAEMKTRSTYEDIGWDFDSIWGMVTCKNSGYPYLIGNYYHECDVNVLSASQVDGKVVLTWEPNLCWPADVFNANSVFVIYRDDTAIASVEIDVFSFMDEDVIELNQYVYHIKAYNELKDIYSVPSNSVLITVQTTSEHEEINPVYVFSTTNYPNPFNPETVIRFEVQGSRFVNIEVYNLRGQKVRTLLDGSSEFGAGSHDVVWNGQDDSGRSMSSGVYLYRIQAGDDVAVRRMLLMK